MTGAKLLSLTVVNNSYLVGIVAVVRVAVVKSES
jgi:hypothetical protein